MCTCASGSRRTCLPARIVGPMTSVVSLMASRHTVRARGPHGVRAAASAGGTLRLLPDARLLGIRKAAADIHEAAPIGALHLPAPRGMRGEPGARRDEPADDDVFLQSAQIVLESAHRGLGEHTGRL